MNAGLRDELSRELRTFATRPVTVEVWADFRERLHYVRGGVEDPATYRTLAGRLAELDREHHTGGGAGPEVVGLIDAIAGPDWSRLDWSASVGASSGIDTYAEAVAALAADPVRTIGFQEESCVRWHMEHEPESVAECVDETHVLRHHVTTPFFVRMALFDSIISGNYEQAGLVDPDLGPFEDVEVAPGVMLPLTFARVLQRELARAGVIQVDVREQQ